MQSNKPIPSPLAFDARERRFAPNKEKTEELLLLSLRPEIEFIPSQTDSHGFPTWRLYDPVRHQYFAIGWLEYELLQRWSLGQAKAILQSIHRETTLNADLSNMMYLVNFLKQNQLLVTNEVSEQKKSSFKKLEQFTSHYLFIKRALWHPDKFLERILPISKIFFMPVFWLVLASITVVVLFLLGRQWDVFIHTYSQFLNPQGLFFFTLTIFLTKIVHELGHAISAKYYGCRVASIGVALIALWPVLYTDTTDAWRLKERAPRLWINAAGALAECSLALLAAILWLCLSDGLLKSLCFFIATTSLAMTLLINLNPLMRFDGYYILADAVNIPNLQNEALNLLHQQIRYWLLGIPKPASPYLPKQQKYILLYAILMWIYRMGLALGIAVLAYQRFFKLLGIVLAIAALWLLLFKPLYQEIKTIWALRDKIHWNYHTKLGVGGLCLAVLLFILPWHGDISAPAALTFRNIHKIYSQAAGQIQFLNLQEGAWVAKEQLLVGLSAAELTKDIQITAADIAIMTNRLQSEKAWSFELGYRQAATAELQKQQAQYRNLQARAAQLQIKAPFAGKVSLVLPGLSVGETVAKDEFLAEIIDPQDVRIEAYIEEHDLHRLKVGDTAIFYPESLDVGSIRATIINIDPVNTDKLAEPMLASLYGGAMPVTKASNGQLILHSAWYRVILRPNEKVNYLSHVVRGEVHVAGMRESFLTYFKKKIASKVIRES